MPSARPLERAPSIWWGGPILARRSATSGSEERSARMVSRRRSLGVSLSWGACPMRCRGRAVRGRWLSLSRAILVQFATTRPFLTPASVKDAYVTGPGDAVLSVHLAMRLNGLKRPGVAATSAVLLRVLPWASQLKSRASTVTILTVSEETLDLYAQMVSALPRRFSFPRPTYRTRKPRTRVPGSSLRRAHCVPLRPRISRTKGHGSRTSRLPQRGGRNPG